MAPMMFDFWRALPQRAIALVRSAKNRALYELPLADSHRNRKYGERAPAPAEFWRSRSGWKQVEIDVRGRRRHLRVKVKGPILRRGCPNQPLFLIIVGGKDQRQRGVSREPLPFLVNAQQAADGQWELPLPLEDLLFWAWQRWEIEVTHRELKSGFGLGDKQCWSPAGALLSVQWSAWVYAMLVLAGYRCWGLTNAPPVATRWWRGGRRWSLNTLWRAYRAALWGKHNFSPVDTQSLLTEGEMRWIQPAMRHAAFAAART